MEDRKSAFAVFEEKLFQAHPELEVLSAFLAKSRRDAFIVYRSLIFEVEQAFSIHEPLVAANKIQWWGDELSRAVAGQAQHPITQRLCELSCIDPKSASTWRGLAVRALDQLDRGKSQDLTAQLFQLERFYAPVARLEVAIMSGSRDVNSDKNDSAAATGTARLLSLAQQVRKLMHWLRARNIETSPIPLNLLARHQKTYFDLAQPMSEWRNVLYDYLDALSAEIERVLVNAKGLDLPCRFQARLNLAEIRRLRRSGNPEQLIAQTGWLIRWTYVWHAWREARAVI